MAIIDYILPYRVADYSVQCVFYTVCVRLLRQMTVARTR